ncbi:peptide chain release factor N(5)-glutamine methyltransferase [Gramella sp. KN1008]|uniref:peptide chain release factor N(5)-glutamine methyltransferase n=1 Tax=Gramella sp. KN1008 TaxID=2529298 RepID=UPI00103EE15B|nr:peptide chain release factor N(5)-glutamine methyltransferase [Gramella sp. KN1008]TBW26746.1 peptide chain release factor N(5)-glutamine methyltransferase [Gramella sp. KN1008]
MLLSHLKIQFIDRLKEDYPVTEIESFFNILTEEYLGMTRLEAALNTDFEVSEEQKAWFEHAELRLKDHEPIQHIIGKEEFSGLIFRVNKEVLIPRPETEELVEWIVLDFKNAGKPIRILDIGTGSGCIAISLGKKLKGSEVHAFDISAEALKLAKDNAKENHVEVNFQERDILKTEKLDWKFDIIVSNPPYVRELEKKEMHRNVLDHEPEKALYVKDEDPLLFYQKIASLAKDALEPQGCLYFEINQYLSTETEELLKNSGFETELKKDIFGNFRMLKASLNR